MPLIRFLYPGNALYILVDDEPALVTDSTVVFENGMQRHLVSGSVPALDAALRLGEAVRIRMLSNRDHYVQISALKHRPLEAYLACYTPTIDGEMRWKVMASAGSGGVEAARRVECSLTKELSNSFEAEAIPRALFQGKDVTRAIAWRAQVGRPLPRDLYDVVRSRASSVVFETSRGMTLMTDIDNGTRLRVVGGDRDHREFLGLKFNVPNWREDFEGLVNEQADAGIWQAFDMKAWNPGAFRPGAWFAALGTEAKTANRSRVKKCVRQLAGDRIVTPGRG